MTRDVDVVVVGAGFAGLYALHRLRSDGLERPGVGGRGGCGRRLVLESLPGRTVRRRERRLFLLLRCATAAGVGLEQEVRHPAGNPSLREPRRRPVRPAARHHVRHPRHRRDIRRRRAAVGNSHRHGRHRLRAFSVLAVGPLSNANIPAIDGLDSFGGAVYHTAHWPHRGRRLLRAAGRRDRHRIIGHPGDSVYRAAGPPAVRVPAQSPITAFRRATSA